jgi:hypothetical protein
VHDRPHTKVPMNMAEDERISVSFNYNLA